MLNCFVRNTAEISLHNNCSFLCCTMKKLSGIVLLLLSFLVSGFGQGVDEMTRINHYVGNWGGYASKSSSISGSVDITSAWVDIVAKKTTSGAIELVGNPWGVKAALKYDKTSARYLLNWSVDGFPPVKELPVQFSEPAGFAGTVKLMVNGKEAEAKATIEEEKDGGSKWTLDITQGKDKWGLRLSLGSGK